MHRILTLCLQLILIENTLAQFGPTLQSTQSTQINQQLIYTPIPNQQPINRPIPNQQPINRPIPNQQPINRPIPKQQLINYLLQNRNQASLPDKIEVLTSAVQNIPTRRTNYQADIFKQSALQSLRTAASFCDSNGNQVLSNLIPNAGLQQVEYNQALSNLAPNSALSLSPQRAVLSLIEYAPQLRQPIGRKIVVANEPLLIAKEPLLVANDLSVLSRSLVSGANYFPNRVGRFLI